MTAQRGYGASGYNKSGGEISFSSRYTLQTSRNGLISKANLSQLQRLDKFGGVAGENMVEITSPCKVIHGTATVLDAGRKGSHSEIVKTSTMTMSWDQNDPRHELV